MKRRDLIKKCDQLRSHILNREWASEDEVAEFWPKHNASLDEWVACFGHLRFIQGRAEAAQPRFANADQIALAALREEPVTLTLENLTQVSVYPKSFNALLWFHYVDYCIAFLADREDFLKTIIEKELPERQQMPQILETLEAISEALGKNLSRIAYAATRAGPATDTDEAFNPPQEFMDLSPSDIVRIHRAFWEVNLMRTSAMPYLVAPQKAGADRPRRMSWSVFGAEMANLFKCDVADILNDKSLVALLAQVRLGSKTLDRGVL